MENSLNKNTHINHTHGPSDWQYEEGKQNTSNHNRENRKYFNRAFTLGAAAATLAIYGGQKLLEPGKELAQKASNEVQELFNPQTALMNETDADVKTTAINGLTNKDIDFDNYTEISLGDGSATVILDKGANVRTNDMNFAGTHPEDNRHTSIFQAEEALEFEIDGKIYKGIGADKMEYLITNIDNFKQTTDGKKINIKDGIDEDGWVAVESSETTLKQE